MSAVCGVFNLDNSSIINEQKSMIMEKLKIYPLDDIGEWTGQGIFLGCGIQYITPESQRELLPLYDKKSLLSITADAIIDNRVELAENLEFSKEALNQITDSELILLAYKKWGEECPKYLCGNFTFVIWDAVKKNLFCVRDHVGARTFYYHYSDNVFSFCTVMGPLISLFDKKMELNERWVTDFLALDGIQHEYECDETIYKGIFQLPPGCSMSINLNGIQLKKYWDPVKDVKPLRLNSDEEYEEAFRNIFSEAVNCRLRNIKDVGIALSGGLDSGSVACLATKQLLEKDKRLKAFSSIPIKNFIDKNPSKYFIKDESNNIEILRNHVGNMDVTYCRCEGKNSFLDIDFFINIFEQPYKSVQTLYWNNDLVKKASDNGCKVILNGQFGNSTISDGEFLIHALTLYRERKFITLLNEIKSFSKIKKISTYKVNKELFKAIIPFSLRKAISKIKNKDYDRFAEVPVNPDLIKKWNVEERFDKKHYNVLTERFLDYYEVQDYTVDPLAFSQIGAIETKMSLNYGIALRDPTRDKRVIEFCLSLPSDQFVRNGEERYLIRRAMKGILPEEIRGNRSTRGLQSADWIQRLQPHRKEIYEELNEILDDFEIRRYIDCNKLKEYLNQLKEEIDESYGSIIRMLLITLVFSRFIKINNL
ncbi:MAG: asparagine synthase-related protein [Clostridiaceae bacterium]